jgi:Cu-Zn family superoxide dismutase
MVSVTPALKLFLKYVIQNRIPLRMINKESNQVIIPSIIITKYDEINDKLEYKYDKEVSKDQIPEYVIGELLLDSKLPYNFAFQTDQARMNYKSHMEGDDYISIKKKMEREEQKAKQQRNNPMIKSAGGRKSIHIKPKSCCKTYKKNNKCTRKTDGKTFSLPRRFTRNQCLSTPRKSMGFTMRSSCAPYKNCKMRNTRKMRKMKGGEKKKTSTKRIATAVLAPNKHKVSGIVSFTEKIKGDKKECLSIHYEIRGLKDGKHGFHIHQKGDLTDGCHSACAHFNPGNHKHGGLCSKIRHLGDLGNITSIKQVAKGTIRASGLSLDPRKKNSIIGRMIIVHDKEDDLGKGGDKESTITGNAGERVACGVIGIA